MTAFFLKGLVFGFLLAATAGRRIGPGLMRGINIVSGCTVLGFAAWQIAQLI